MVKMSWFHKGLQILKRKQHKKFVLYFSSKGKNLKSEITKIYFFYDRKTTSRIQEKKFY